MSAGQPIGKRELRRRTDEPMKFISICCTVMMLVLAGHTDVAAQVTGDITIESNPPGAWITLKGAATLSGISPVRFQQPLIGEYRLLASKPGYETSSTRVLLQPGRPLQFSVDLAPKTRLKAGLRSLLMAGWGQRYSDRTGRGIGYFTLSLCAGAAYLIADNNFDKKYFHYRGLLRRYEAAVSSPDRQALWSDLQNAQADAYDAEDLRRITIGVAGGIWALNFLDAIILFPRVPETIPVKSLSLVPTVAPDAIGLRLAGRF